MTPAPRGRADGPIARLWQRLRRSMSAQIWISVTLVATVLVSGSSAMVLALYNRELHAIGEALMLGTLASVQKQLQAHPDAMAAAPQAALATAEPHVSRMHAALFDEAQQLLAASDGFDLPAAALPTNAVSVAELPGLLTVDVARQVRGRLGNVTRPWASPAGVPHLLMSGWVRVQTAQGPERRLLAVVALETTVPTRLKVYGTWIIVLAVLLSAFIAAGLGVLLAGRIVVAARGFGAAAGRIGARELGERLDLSRLPDELQEAGLALNHMLERLQVAFQHLREFSVDLAHDLRTPINNLLGEAQVALSRPRDVAEYRAVLESAVEDYERMARLIENLLFLSRHDDEPMPLQREWIDLAELCRRARDYFEPLAEEADLQVAVQTPTPDVVWLWADRLLLIRALGNLVTNALRHARPGSTVMLGCAGGAWGASLSVSNEGEPIPAEFHQRIFDRLFRIDPSRQGSTSGSGLGLAIVKSVLARHGGQVQLRSAEGVPTTFTLRFPPPPADASPPA